MSKVVYVVGGDPSVVQMFHSEGWTVQLHTGEIGGSKPFVDLICFTGGADVSPELYGEKNEGLSHTNPKRDEQEVEIYKKFVGKVPMVGICRGGQFLNVMNGGKLIQHLGKTVSGIVSAWAFYEQDGDEHKVHVDHHQGIIPTDKAVGYIHGPEVPSKDNIAYACFYPDTKCLCFQPHPEWGHEPTKELFFQLISKYIGEVS